MTFREKHLVEKMHKNSIPEVISFEKWKYMNFNELYSVYLLTDKEFTFAEFARGLFDHEIILEYEKRIN